MVRIMLVVLAISLGTVTLACQSSTPVRTEHGWKTKHVTATRYKNDLMGYNIGFDFPLNPDDCDRDEIVQYIEKRSGGHIYEMGGSPGAIVYATFDGVKDRATADAKLVGMLPGLEKVVAAF